MSRRSIRKEPSKSRPVSSETRIATTATAQAGGSVPTPDNAEPPRSGAARWLVLTTILGVGLGFVVLGANYRNVAPVSSESPKVESIVDRFVRLRNEKNPDALELLGPPPVFDMQPVSEKTAEARQTDFFLRAELRFVKVRAGEPDGDGNQRSAPGRFTIVTKGSLPTPHLRIRTDKGVSAPTSLSMFNPDLVVEVRDGKICGLRTELPTGR